MKNRVPLRKIPMILFLAFILYYVIFFFVRSKFSMLNFILITILFFAIEILLFLLSFKDKYDSNYKLINHEKFLQNEKYRNRKIKNLYKQEDKAYKRNIAYCKKTIKKLIEKRNKEMARLAALRWTEIEGLHINQEEGKVAINKNIYWFSDIKGASINSAYGVRGTSQTVGTTQSKKKASLGGALVGGMLTGGVGAVIGGSVLGKTKTNTEQSTTTNNISTCEHLGVNVNINGFISEIIILNSAVDQDSSQYSNAMEKAQRIISLLERISFTPVPKNREKIEDKASVTNITREIETAKSKLEFAVQDKPKHKLPDELNRLIEQNK